VTILSLQKKRICKESCWSSNWRGSTHGFCLSSDPDTI